MMRKLAAEFIGTAWLVLGGCGAAVLAAAFPQLGIGFVGVALAFGLTVLTMAFAIGHVSGCHLNPAVSVGLWAGGRFPAGDLPGYIIAQVAGGIAGAGILYLIASGHAGFDVHAGFASNGYGEHSPGGYGMTAALVCEVVMTFAFLFVILGSTHGRAPGGFRAHRHRPLPHLDPFDLDSRSPTPPSIRPVRPRPLLFAGGWALDQLWLFWVAPILGAMLAGFVYRWLSPDEPEPADVSGR